MSKFEEPQYWDDQRRACEAYNEDDRRDYRRFAAWLVGQETDQNGSRLRGKLGRSRGPLSNLISLAIRVARSNLFYRSPRFMVQDLPTLGGKGNGKKIAQIETMMLDDAVDECDLYTEGRRCILDGLIGPEMVMKVGYTSDVGVDFDRIEAERKHASAEGEAIRAGGRPRRGEDDADCVHMEEHQRQIAMAEEGSWPTDEGSLAYLKKHYKAHEDALKKFGDRPLETVRFESLIVERVSPMKWWRDMTASRPAERSWVQESFLRLVDDVRENPNYEPGARKEVQATDSGEDGADALGKDGYARDPVRSPDDYVTIYEVVDLRRSKILTFASGGKKCLRVRDYKDQRTFPGGPYITGSFLEDPITDCGVAMPRIYEGHQDILSQWDDVGAKTLMRGVPVKVVKKGVLDADTLKKLQNNRRVPDSWVVASDLGANDDINKVIQQLDPPAIPEFLFALRRVQESGIERQTGGSAQLGGGDTSKTATASATVQESSSNISEDLASVMDNFLSRIGRGMVRVMRRYPESKVSEIYGEGAVGVWPKWSERAICRDRGVSVVPGSSRRKNLAVEQKLLTDLYVAVQSNPNIGVEVGVELFRRVLDASGVFNVDLSGMQEMMQRQEIEGLMPGGGSGAEGGAAPPSGKDRASRRSKARGSGAPSDQRGGLANAGGGRVPTGASAGDKGRMMR